MFGPAVSAQYGATLMWLASIDIVFQVFCNLMMMPYQPVAKVAQEQKMGTATNSLPVMTQETKHLA